EQTDSIPCSGALHHPAKREARAVVRSWEAARVTGLANFGLQRTSTSLHSALAAEAVIRWADDLSDAPMFTRRAFAVFLLVLPSCDRSKVDPFGEPPH